MPGKDATKLSKRTVDTLCVQSKEAVFWDRDLPGFGVRVYTTGRKVYVVQSRGPDGPKRVTIGRHGKISAEQARKDAAVLIDRIKRGKPPVPPPPVPAWTVSALAERYMEAHVAVSCRPATIKIYRAVVTKYILPELGELPIDAVAVGHRGAPPAAADRMPAGRSRNAALGRCGPHGGGTTLTRFQDRCAPGSIDAGGGGGAGRHSPHRRQSLGDRGPETSHASA